MSDTFEALKRTPVISVRDTLDGMMALGSRGSLPVPAPQLPEAIDQWLENFLWLEGIPLEWLVPDPTKFLNDSIYMFFVDLNWIGSLLDGILVAGSLGEQDHMAMSALRNTVRAKAKNAAKKGRSGFLLRSAAVRNCPTLKIEGRDAEGRLVDLRRRQLSDSVLLVVFEEVPTKIVFQEPPLATRFQVEEGGKISSAKWSEARLSFEYDSQPWDLGRISGAIPDPDEGYIDIGAVVYARSHAPGASEEDASPAGIALCFQDQPFTLTLS
jgi:hypothetical protein